MAHRNSQLTLAWTTTSAGSVLRMARSLMRASILLLWVYRREKVEPGLNSQWVMRFRFQEKW